MEYEIVVIGGGGAGKTALVVQFVQSHFVEEYDPTIENSYRKMCVVDGESCLYNILDTGGQDEYRGALGIFIFRSQCIILVFDITRRESFETAKSMFEQVRHSRPSTPIVLVGNKADLESLREVSKEEAYEFAREIGSQYFECSAKDHTSVEQVFYEAVRRIRHFQMSTAMPTAARPRKAKAKGFIGLEALFRCVGFCIGGACLIFLPLLFLLLLLLQVITILPYLFVLLVFFPTTIETDTVKMNERSEQLDKESKVTKGFRIASVMLSSIPMAFLLIGYPLLIVYWIIPSYATPDNVAWVALGSIGSLMVAITGLSILSMIRHHKAFNLMQRKPEGTHVNWKNYRNWMAVVAILVEIVQVITLPLHISGEKKIKELVGPLFLNLQWVKGLQARGMDISFTISASIVVLLLITYTLQFMIDMRTWYSSSEKKEARERFFYSFGGTLVYGHNNLKYAPVTGTLIQLLTDTLLMIVCLNLLDMISCSYSGTDLGVLVNDPSTKCWEGSHSAKAALSLIMFAYYLPLSVMVSPMLTEAGQTQEVKDIKFKTAFVMTISLLKTLIFIVPVLFQQTETSRQLANVFSDFSAFVVILVWIFGKSRGASFLQEPCSVPQVNIWRSFPFIGGFLLSFSVVVGLEYYFAIGIIPLLLIFGIASFHHQRTAKRMNIGVL